MSRYNPYWQNAALTYDAAEHWRDRCLLDDGSVFSETQLWTEDHFNEIFLRVFEQPEFRKDFISRLVEQLEPASAETRQLAAEMIWVLELHVAANTTSAETKRLRIRQLWNYGEHEFLEDKYLEGLGSPGQSYNSYRWRELLTFTLFMRYWKALERSNQRVLLRDGWKFAKQYDDWVAEWTGADEWGVKTIKRSFRHAILHLLFPDEFEKIFVGADKEKILYHYYLGDVPEAWLDRDRLIFDIRERFEDKEQTKELDFYDRPLNKWRTEPEPDSEREKEPDSLTERDMPLNLIYYGPAGTGKTYQAVNDALQLLDPAFFEINKGNQKKLGGCAVGN